MKLGAILLASAICLASFGATGWAAPQEDDNPCDPDNGKYICDGTEDYPNGYSPWGGQRTKLPDTGISKVPTDDNPCDPDNDKYICDGTEDYPNGYSPWGGQRTKLPDTGVSDVPNTEDESFGDDGVSSSLAVRLPQPIEVQQILAERRAAAELRAAISTPTASYLPRNHQAQKHRNWCGPASMAMALDHMGVKRTQESLAKAAGIGTSGAGVGLGTMQSVLNNIGKSHGFAWDIQYLPFRPSSSDKVTYKKRLVTSITGQTGSGKKYPLIVNFHILKTGGRPEGYPKERDIRHHVEVRGYKGSGEWTQIQEPATSIWPKTHAHYPWESDKVVIMAGDRGYLY